MLGDLLSPDGHREDGVLTGPVSVFDRREEALAGPAVGCRDVEQVADGQTVDRGE